MENTNEALLEAWLRLSTAINNERVVSDLPYNESLLCNLLYRNQLLHPDQPMTATQLCAKMRMQKSQMNRTLTSLEKKGIICRERSASDKRQIFITLNPERTDIYEKQHQEILALIDALLGKIGREKAEEIIALFRTIADTADELLS